MVKHYSLVDNDICIDNAIQRHSADKCVIYKILNGEPIYLGFYYPQNYDRKAKYPVFFFVHGGGWRTHKVFEDQAHWQGDYLGYLARYYADKGFVCVSIDYRLLREQGQVKDYELIDCYEDCCDAIDYVIEHAHDYSIDILEIYLLGESAGGHLAGALATFHYDRKYLFKKVFLINAITHFNDKWKIFIPKESNHPILKELSFDECIFFLSPLSQVQKDVCEVVLIHGEDDATVNPEHSLMLYKRMKECGCICELHLIEETQHAFLLAEYYKKGNIACKIAIDIIDANVL